MKSLALCLMLAFSSPAPLGHVYGLGTVARGHLLKTVNTRDGVVRVYRTAAGCDLWLGGVWEQSVTVNICEA